MEEREAEEAETAKEAAAAAENEGNQVEPYSFMSIYLYFVHHMYTFDEDQVELSHAKYSTYFLYFYWDSAVSAIISKASTCC